MLVFNYARRTKLPSSAQIDVDFPIRDVDWGLIEKEDGWEGAEGVGDSVGGSSGGGNDVIRSTWIGHASLLVQMGGWNMLTDPVFGARCSPVPVGPKRYRRYVILSYVILCYFMLFTLLYMVTICMQPVLTI